MSLQSAAVPSGILHCWPRDAVALARADCEVGTPAACAVTDRLDRTSAGRAPTNPRSHPFDRSTLRAQTMLSRARRPPGWPRRTAVLAPCLHIRTKATRSDNYAARARDQES